MNDPVEAHFAADPGNDAPADSPAVNPVEPPQGASNPAMIPGDTATGGPWPTGLAEVLATFGPPQQRRFSFADAVQSLGGGLLRTDGRLARSEYWWGGAILAMVWVPITLALLALTESGSLLVIAAAALGLLVFLPFVAFLECLRAVRRMHDVGHSGWWVALALAPFGIAAVLWLLTRAGTRGANQFGPMSQPGWDWDHALAS